MMGGNSNLKHLIIIYFMIVIIILTGSVVHGTEAPSNLKKNLVCQKY